MYVVVTTSMLVVIIFFMLLGIGTLVLPLFTAGFCFLIAAAACLRVIFCSEEKEGE